MRRYRGLLLGVLLLHLSVALLSGKATAQPTIGAVSAEPIRRLDYRRLEIEAVSWPSAKPQFSQSHQRKLAANATSWKSLARNTVWQWQLDDDGTIPTIKGVQMYDIDMDTAATQVADLRREVSGVQVVCYISVGTWESQRQELDQSRRGIKPSDWDGLKGKSYAPPFQDERWLDIRNPRVKDIMSKRFDFAQSIGCDGVEPDNTGGYLEDTGFPLTKADSLAYSQWVTQAVHARSMSVGLKNTAGLLPQLHTSVDWFLNEQCSEDNSCSEYDIVGDIKPVFGVEYCDATEQENGVTQDPGCFCPGLIAAGFQWLIKTTDLNEPRVSCQQYCTMFDCPGRKGRGNCNAGKSSVCETAFKASSVPTAAPAMQPAVALAVAPALQPAAVSQPALEPATSPQAASPPTEAPQLATAPQPALQPAASPQPALPPAEAPQLLAPQPVQNETGGGLAADAPGLAVSPAPEPQAAVVLCDCNRRTMHTLVLCAALLAWV